MLEVAEVGVHIEGEAVHGDPATGADAEGADLACFEGVGPVQPHACQPIDAASLDAISSLFRRSFSIVFDDII